MTIRTPPEAVWQTQHLLGSIRRFLDQVEPALEASRDRDVDAFRDRVARESGAIEDSGLLTRMSEIEDEFNELLLPMLAHACLTLLYSAVETQLAAVLGHVRERSGVKLRVSELNGSPVEKAAVYLRKVLGIAITHGSDWQSIRDLELLRNVVVHANARIPDGSKNAAKLRALTLRHSDGLVIRESEGMVAIRIPVRFTRRLLDDAERFFHRLFEAAGLETQFLIEDSAED